MKKEQFLKISNPSAFRVKIKEDEVTFFTNQRGINKIKALGLADVIIFNNYKALIKKLFLNNSLFILSIILIFIILLLSNSFIKGIKFENENYYDVEIENVVKSHLNKKILGFKLDIKINELNKELRKKYPFYAYIGLMKKGSVLIIEIKKEEKHNTPPESKVKGSVFAKYDAYIKAIIARQGKVVVSTKQSVKKGDLLISGNLLYPDATLADKYVCAEGIVIGDVAIYETIVVKKRKVINDYTSNISSYYQVLINDKEILKTKNKALNAGHSEISNIFNLFNFIKVFKITDYEKALIEVNYDFDEALSYARSLIKYNFELEKKSDKEYIHYIDLIEKNEKAEEFEFSFLVRMTKDIGVFQEN